MTHFFSNIWLLILTASMVISCDSQGSLTIKMHSPDLSPDSIVYITGSTSDLGNWQPNALKMNYIGEQIWEIKIPNQPPKIIEYKYTLGSWESENADANGLPLPNFEWQPGFENPKVDQVLFWKNGSEQSIQGQITGSVRYHEQIEFEGLLARDLIVWLPPSYETSDMTYPVLYMHDGQNIIDPATSSFGVDWQVDETLTKLIQEKAFPEIIVVGIYNTAERTQDYTPGSQSNVYLQFIRTKLKPLIDQNYRTKIQRANTFIGGSSYGGMISMKAIWEHSDLFSAALCFSPAFKTKDFNYIETIQNTQNPPSDIWIYMDNGGVGLEAILQPGIEDMMKVLPKKSLIEDENWVFVLDKEARHFEADWAKRFPDALRLLNTHLEKRQNFE